VPLFSVDRALPATAGIGPGEEHTAKP